MSPRLFVNAVFVFLFASAVTAEPAWRGDLIIDDIIQSVIIGKSSVPATETKVAKVPICPAAASDTPNALGVPEPVLTTFNGDDWFGTKKPAPKGVNADWWSRVQRGLAESEYHPNKSKQGLQAPNRAHNLRTYF